MSTVVPNLYKLDKNSEELFESLFFAKNEYQKKLEDRIPEIIEEVIHLFMRYEEFDSGKGPKTYQQWCSYCYKTLKKDVAKQKNERCCIDSWFTIAEPLLLKRYYTKNRSTHADNLEYIFEEKED